jgi:hypothetical protein
MVFYFIINLFRHLVIIEKCISEKFNLFIQLLEELSIILIVINCNEIIYEYNKNII